MRPVAAGPDAVVLGQVVAAFGVDGRVRVRPFTRSVASLLDFRELLLGGGATGKPWLAVEVRGGRVHADHLLLYLAGVANREQAAALRGQELAVRRQDLPPADPEEIYLVDLLGAEVVQQGGRSLGRIEGFLEAGPTQVMRVCEAGERGGKSTEWLIPFVPEYVLEVERAPPRVTVDWPDAA